jgi:hypothetical protein
MIELIVFIVGFGLGWFINGWFSAQAFHSILMDLGVPEDKILALADKEESGAQDSEAELKVIEIKVEHVGGRLMAYRADDDFFVAQGDDAAALIDELVSRYSEGHRIKIVEGGELVEEHVNSLTKAL